MMNKRNTEGYVLAYVLIVVTVMGLIAATLITSTLQVIQAQENSIEYMKDKYAAQGEIEKLIASLETLQTPLSSAPSTTSSDAERLALLAFSHHIPSFAQEGVIVPSTGVSDTNTKSVTFDVTSTHGKVTITAQIITSPIYTLPTDTIPAPTEQNPNNTRTIYGYEVTGAKTTKINSYTITGGDS